jgi:hypothetical protein
MFHSIFSLLFHSIFGAVSQYLFLLIQIINYWHYFQLYSGLCYCTVLFSAIFQLYSRLCYCAALFPPFPALFPAVLMYSFIPGHVTVQHYSRPFQVLFPTVLPYSFIPEHLFAVCGLLIAVKTIIICLLLFGSAQ